MKTRLRRALIAAFCAFIALNAGAANNRVVVLEVKGGIGVATTDYILSGLE